MGCSLTGSSVLGISQVRILEWVAISFSREFSLPRDQTRISRLPHSFFTIEPPGKPFGDSLLVVVFIGLYWWYVSLESSKRTAATAAAAKSLQSCPTLCKPVDCRLLCPGDSPGKNTGVGCHFLLQGIFPTQGSNPGLPHWRQTL